MNFLVYKANKIEGEINVSGSKNAALPIIAAALLIKEKVILTNVPFISDVIGMIRIIESIGAKVKYNCNEGILEITSKKISYKVASPYVDKMRASYYLMGVLVSRKKYFEISYPGGCNFDERPIDIHLAAFRKLNVEIEEAEIIKFRINNFIPATIKLPISSVGATINIILSAAISKGITIIENASIEPEVLDVINFLNNSGANILVFNKNIIINGVDKLNSITYKIMNDRIEACSYLLLASAVPNSNLKIKNINTMYIEEVLNTLKQMGCTINVKENEIKLISPDKLNKINLVCDIYPSFPTDLQPIVSSALLKAYGESVIIDKVYPKRISHIKEFQKLGANIKYEEEKIIIKKSNIEPKKVIATDLRCGFALIIAGAISNSYIEIANANIILRGYEDVINKLKSIGVTIEQKF